MEQIDSMGMHKNTHLLRRQAFILDLIDLGWKGPKIAEFLGTTPARVTQIRMQSQRIAASIREAFGEIELESRRQLLRNVGAGSEYRSYSLEELPELIESHFRPEQEQRKAEQLKKEQLKIANIKQKLTRDNELIEAEQAKIDVGISAAKSRLDMFGEVALEKALVKHPEHEMFQAVHYFAVIGYNKSLEDSAERIANLKRQAKHEYTRNCAAAKRDSNRQC